MLDIRDLNIFTKCLIENLGSFTDIPNTIIDTAIFINLFKKEYFTRKEVMQRVYVVLKGGESLGIRVIKFY